MAKQLFSVPIFFIAFRECLEASLIIAILLGLVEQIVHTQVSSATTSRTVVSGVEDDKDSSHESGSVAHPHPNTLESSEDAALNKRVLIRKMRIQVSPSHLTSPSPH